MTGAGDARGDRPSACEDRGDPNVFGEDEDSDEDEWEEEDEDDSRFGVIFGNVEKSSGESDTGAGKLNPTILSRSRAVPIASIMDR